MHGAACKPTTESATGVSYGFELYASTTADVVCPLTSWTDNVAKPEVTALTLHVGTNGTITCTAYAVNSQGRIFDSQTVNATGPGWAKTVFFNKTFTSNLQLPYDPDMSMFVMCRLPGNSAIYKLTWSDYQ